MASILNPYRPGAGHKPPYLAGREKEQNEFRRLLTQTTIFENFILTGLRGVGKTVLLETLKPIAIKESWIWVGTDLSESASLSEVRLATRLLTDLAVVTSSLTTSASSADDSVHTGKLGFNLLVRVFNEAPGLVSDKLKTVLEFVWERLKKADVPPRGVVFAYDEAQNMSDHAARDEFPLSLMLEVFQSIQKKEIPFMLVFVGLPTLFPKLVEARTYSERMFHVVTLSRLTEAESREAILRPINKENCAVKFTEPGIKAIVATSGGYPYFIQFICREAFDAYLQTGGANVAIGEIARKLDTDFFMGRWTRATDRQRELLNVVAHLENADGEFSVMEVCELTEQRLEKPMSKSQINQMFIKLSELGLVFKTRHGRYSFAVPLLGDFILRQEDDGKMK